MTARTVTRSRRSSTVTAARTLICACGSQNEIAVEVWELMNQQLPQDSHSLIGAYKDKAQAEFF